MVYLHTYVYCIRIESRSIGEQLVHNVVQHTDWSGLYIYLYIKVYKNHLKMVQGCRIDTGSCKKPLSKKDSPKTLETRLSCKTGTGLGGQRARQA